MSQIKSLTDQIVAFRDARDWKQFHNAKDLALSLSLEAAEVLELYQWKTGPLRRRNQLHKMTTTPFSAPGIAGKTSRHGSRRRIF